MLQPAWFPWRIKTMPDGGLDTELKFFFKHAYTGMTVRHPATVYDTETGQTQSAQDLARQMGEQAKSGADELLGDCIMRVADARSRHVHAYTDAVDDSARDLADANHVEEAWHLRGYALGRLHVSLPLDSDAKQAEVRQLYDDAGEAYRSDAMGGYGAGLNKISKGR